MGNVIQAKTFQLQAPIWSTDTTIAVKNLETIYGDDVVMAGSIQYSTLEPESQSNQEIISFTGITAVSTNVWNLTGVTRGLDAQPTAWVYGNNPAQGKAHASSVDCILSDSPQVWDDKASKSEDEAITGVYSFTQSPTVPTPDSTLEVANKDYVDNSASAGSSDSNTTTIGISRQSYSSSVTIGTCTMTIASPCVVSFTSHGLTLNDSIQFTTTWALPTGLLASTTYYVISAGLTANAFQIATTRWGTAINTTGSQSGVHTLYKTTPVAVNTLDPRVPTQAENDALVGNNTDVAVGTGNKMVTQTGLQHGAEQYAVISSASTTAYVATLSPAPTSLTAGMKLRAKIDVANTTTTPSINFNGIGAKTIVKWVSTALAIWDMPANLIADFVYDGTNMVLQNPDSTLYQEFVFTSTGTWVCPRWVTSVLVDMVAGGGGGGGCNNVTWAAGGGGGWAWVFNLSSSVTPLTAYTVTVGAGGAWGNNAPNNGTAGWTTTFNGVSKTWGSGGMQNAWTGSAAGGAAWDATAGAGGAWGATATNGTAGAVGSNGWSGWSGGGLSGSFWGGGGGGASGIGANGWNGWSGLWGAGSVGNYWAWGGWSSNQGNGWNGWSGLVIIKVPIKQYT